MEKVKNIANSTELQFWLMSELPESTIEKIQQATVEVSPFTKTHKVKVMLKNGITLRFVWSGPKSVAPELIVKIALFADSQNETAQTVYI